MTKKILKKTTKTNNQILKIMEGMVEKQLKKIAKNPLYRNVENEVRAEIARKNVRVELQQKFKKLPNNLNKILKEAIAVKIGEVSLSSRVVTAASIGEGEGGPVGALISAVETIFEEEKKRKKPVKKSVKKVIKKTKSKK